MIVGVMGYARSGKDSVGRVLVDRFGYRRVGLADRVRAALEGLDPLVLDAVSGVPVSLSTALRQSGGWSEIKSDPRFGDAVRDLMIRMGSRAGREGIDPDVWVWAALRHLRPRDRVVVTDVRFENEVGFLRGLGGVVWRVRRPGVGPARDDPSETTCDSVEPDDHVDNDGTLEDLSQAVAGALGRLGTRVVVPA